MSKCKHGNNEHFCCKCRYGNTGKHDLSPRADDPRDLIDEMNGSINKHYGDLNRCGGLDNA